MPASLAAGNLLGVKVDEPPLPRAEARQAASLSRSFRLDGPMLLVERVLGSRVDPSLSDRLHHLEHHGRVDILTLPSAELARRRFRAMSEAGQEVAIALPRDQQLFDGAVLLLDEARALVVRVDAQRWLRLQPRSISDAVELGYHAGNLHWRVRFQGETLLVALEGSVDSYLERLGTLVTDRRVAASVSQADEI